MGRGKMPLLSPCQEKKQPLEPEPSVGACGPLPHLAGGDSTGRWDLLENERAGLSSEEFLNLTDWAK